MPVYDFSSGLGLLNQGIGSLGASLKAADQNAYQQAVGAKLADGDYEGAANLAFARGDIDTGQKLAQVKQQRDFLTSTAPAGSGGVFGGTTTGGTLATAAPSSAPASTAPLVSGASPGYGSTTRQDVANMITDAARARGVDPGKAMAVFAGEGLTDYVGDKGSSFGPLQLHMGGLSAKYPNSGMGDDFKRATGLDPRDPSTIKQQIEFGLDQAIQNGWGAWTSQKGRPKFEGIGANAQPRGISVAGAAGTAVPGGQQIAPSGMGLPQFATSAATPAQQVAPRSASGQPIPSLGPSAVAAGTPSDIAPSPTGIQPVPGAMAANAAPPPAGALPPMPPMVSGVTGGPAIPAVAPVQVASLGGGVPAPDAGAASASAVPQATIDKFQADMPGEVGNETKLPDGSFKVNDTDAADLAWAKANAAKYGLAQDPADPTHFIAAPGGAVAPAPTPRAIAISQTQMDSNATPKQAQTSVNQLLSSLPAGDQRRIDFLQGQALKYARGAMLGIKGADDVAKVYETALAKEQEAASPTSTNKDYQFYATQERSEGRTPLSFNDWQHQPAATTTWDTPTAEQLVAKGIDPTRRGDLQINSQGELRAVPQETGDAAKFAARTKEARALGMDVTDPRTVQFIATGTMPDPNKFTREEEHLISDTADKNDKFTLAIGSLKQARNLLPNTYSGSFATQKAWLARNDPTGIMDAQAGADTTEFDKLVQLGGLGTLKDIYGGKVAVFEAQQYAALQPDSGKSMLEKQQILDDIINRYETQQKYTQAKLEALQGKRFFGAKGPGGEQSTPPSRPQSGNPTAPLQVRPGGAPAVVAPSRPAGRSDADLIGEAKAAIAAGASPDAVKQRLQQMGVSGF